MKIYKSNPTPSWEEIEITGKSLNRELTVLEFKEAYDSWIPEDNISFEKLIEIVLHITPSSPMVDKDTIIIYFQEVFNQIKNGLDRKEALASFLVEVSHYRLNIRMRKGEKDNRYTAYYKNWEQKIKGNKAAAVKVYESLIKEGAREGTKTTQLANLLIEYTEQCNEILNSTERVIEPLEIKDYKLTPEKTKEPIKECLRNIIKEFDITVKSYDFKSAIESL